MSRRADADPAELDTDLDDLDGALDLGDDVPGEHRSRLPGWARSRWAVPAAATAVVVLLGAAGVHQARVAAAADVARAELMTSVQLGSASLLYAGDPESVEHDAEGRLLQTVQVGVRDSGDGPVELRVVSTSVEHTAVVPDDEPLSLRAGSGGTLSVALAVDCDAVPPPSDGSSSGAAALVGTETLRLAVTAGGETSERDYLLPEAGWGGVGQQLTYACSPDAWGQTLSGSTTEDAAGRLLVQLTNASDEEARIQLQARPSLRVTADPALPLVVPAGGSADVVLAVDPDCTRLSGEGRDPSALEVNLLHQEDGANNTFLDTTSTAVWVARQVALRCG